MDQQWLTVEQVADRLQAHPETVRGWLRDGKLRGNRISKRAGWRVTPEELQRFIGQDAEPDYRHKLDALLGALFHEDDATRARILAKAKELEAE